MRTAAAYVRVSDERQEEFSPDSQIKRLKEYAENNDMLLPDELIFRDDGISGKKADKRPQFTQMIAIAKQKERPFDVILVWKFSRFARNQEESIVYKSMLKKSGVDVISISEPIESNPFGGLIERIIEWMDEYYVIRLSDEVRRGMTERAMRGLPNVAPPFGYTMVNGDYQIVEEEAEIVRQIYQMFLDGYGLFHIARNLCARDVQTKRGKHITNRGVEYILNNSVYNGYLRWNPNGRSASNRIFNNPEDIVAKGTYTPIIDDETFAAVKQKLAERRANARKYERSETPAMYMLRGLARCNDCGSALVYTKSTGSLQCHRYSKGTCSISHSIKIELIDKMVIEELKKYMSFLDLEFKGGTVTQPRVTVDELDYEALIKTEKLKLSRAKQAYQAGVDSLEEYRASKKKIDEEIQRIEGERDRKYNESGITNKELRDMIANAIEIISNPQVSADFKNKTLKAFIKEVIYYRPENKIKIVFLT